ncbi:MAG: dihydropteroate synthase [Candidatus Goldiibacteriota bacterium]
MFTLHIGKSGIEFENTCIMAVVNVTPDSFSDGGMFFEKDKAAARAAELFEKGADIVDIGGESTRPGAEAVDEKEEIARIKPVIAAVKEKKTEGIISVDTYKSAAAKEALEAGADIINDISGGLFDPDMFETAAEYGAGYVLMHIKGEPGNMQKNPVYSDKGVVFDILEFFEKRIKEALKSGIKEEKIIIDPGIGFGKTLKDNYEILKSLREFKKIGRPVMTGVSRKSFIGALLGKKTGDRIFGTAAAVAASILNGADIVRIHDISEMKETAAVCDAVKRPQSIKEAV